MMTRNQVRRLRTAVRRALHGFDASRPGDLELEFVTREDEPEPTRDELEREIRRIVAAETGRTGHLRLLERMPIN